MDKAARDLPEYNCLDERTTGKIQHTYIKGKDITAIDVYAASLRGKATLDALIHNYDLTKEEILQAIRFCEWHRDEVETELAYLGSRNGTPGTQEKLYQLARILIPAILFFFGILISIAFKGLFSIIVGIFCFILFLRFANEIPVFGWAWVKIFGRQDLWEWLRMTIAPVAIGIVGTYVTTTINRYQNQANIEKARNDITTTFLAAYQPDSNLYARSMALVDKRKEETQPHKQSCRTTHDSEWLSIHARTTLSQISSLEPPRDINKTVQKRPVLEFLHQNNLIRRGRNIVSLIHADLSDSLLTWADLSDSCLNQVKFIDYPATRELASDLRHARLDGSDLTGSTLRRANLRYASLRGVDLRNYTSLSGADLRGADLTNALIDKNTRMTDAIVNTQKIEVDAHKNNSLYGLVCNRSVQDAVQWTFLCVDSIDYLDLDATRLPFFIDDDGSGKPISCEKNSHCRPVICLKNNLCGYTDRKGRFQVLRTAKGKPMLKVENRVPTL